MNMCVILHWYSLYSHPFFFRLSAISTGEATSWAQVQPAGQVTRWEATWDDSCCVSLSALSRGQRRCPSLAWIRRCINIWRVMWAVRKTFWHITNHLEACPGAVPSGRLCTCRCQRDKVFWPACISRNDTLFKFNKWFSWLLILVRKSLYVHSCSEWLFSATMLVPGS